MNHPFFVVETRDASGQLAAFNQTVVFLQRAGGFGGRRTSDKLRATADPPKRAPDASIREQTGLDQVCYVKYYSKFKMNFLFNETFV